MLDIKFIRENKDLIKAAAQKKRLKFDLNDLITVDDKRKELLLSVDSKRAEQNAIAEKVAQILRSPAFTSATPTENELKERDDLLEKSKKEKGALAEEEEKLKEVMKEWQALMVKVPNIPDMSVPDGESDKDNKEVRSWGNKPQFNFDVRSHIDLMKAHDMIDLDRGSKVAGFRGYILKNDAVCLQFAIQQFLIDTFAKKGFTPMIVPSLVKKAPLIGTGYLPQGEEDLYKTQDGDYLAGTAEVATMGYYMDEVIDMKKLPLKFFSYSQCFRREAGSHGKDTKGLIRVHEFTKFEQVVLCEANHETSVALHEEITVNAEELLQALNLPYRVVVNCGADLGLGQVKKYDIETWVPSENTYRETHSASYFHDFQTRRFNIRYKDVDGKMKFAHSLNNTALAMPRILVPIIENNQNEDGTINIPAALLPYMRGKTKIG
jgi:seryl-tRNA synthetase